jgi:hypothetical protein
VLVVRLNKTLWGWRHTSQAWGRAWNCAISAISSQSPRKAASRTTARRSPVRHSRQSTTLEGYRSGRGWFSKPPALPGIFSEEASESRTPRGITTGGMKETGNGCRIAVRHREGPAPGLAASYAELGCVEDRAATPCIPTDCGHMPSYATRDALRMQQSPPGHSRGHRNV